MIINLNCFGGGGGSAEGKLDVTVFNEFVNSLAIIDESLNNSISEIGIDISNIESEIGDIQSRIGNIDEVLKRILGDEPGPGPEPILRQIYEINNLDEEIHISVDMARWGYEYPGIELGSEYLALFNYVVFKYTPNESHRIIVSEYSDTLGNGGYLYITDENFERLNLGNGDMERIVLDADTTYYIFILSSIQENGEDGYMKFKNFNPLYLTINNPINFDTDEEIEDAEYFIIIDDEHPRSNFWYQKPIMFDKDEIHDLKFIRDEGSIYENYEPNNLVLKIGDGYYTKFLDDVITFNEDTEVTLTARAKEKKQIPVIISKAWVMNDEDTTDADYYINFNDTDYKSYDDVDLYMPEGTNFKFDIGSGGIYEYDIAYLQVTYEEDGNTETFSDPTLSEIFTVKGDRVEINLFVNRRD